METGPPLFLEVVPDDFLNFLRGMETRLARTAFLEQGRLPKLP